MVLEIVYTQLSRRNGDLDRVQALKQNTALNL